MTDDPRADRRAGQPRVEPPDGAEQAGRAPAPRAEPDAEGPGAHPEREGARRGRGALVSRVLIQNRLGLHARAAAQFVRAAAAFQAEISVEAGGRKVNGKSIMGLLMLAAAQGTSLTLRAVGADAAAALEALATLVAQRFGEAE
jgi:phosphocarrier protein